MKIKPRNGLRMVSLALSALLAGCFANGPVNAQSPELQARLADIKEASAKNKQMLAQYTWVEQDTISLKGEQKKQEHFQVRLGPDGKQQKTSLDPAPQQQQESGRRGRLKEHIVEKKTDELKEYADQLKALAQQYVPPDKDMLQQAYAAGNITLGSVAGMPASVQLVVRNYVKQGDSLTLVFDKTQKKLVSVQVASYLNDPKDAMNLNVQFTSLPDGTNHVSNMVMNGVSKELTVAVANSNYQHL